MQREGQQPELPSALGCDTRGRNRAAGGKHWPAKYWTFHRRAVQDGHAHWESLPRISQVHAFSCAPPHQCPASRRVKDDLGCGVQVREVGKVRRVERAALAFQEWGLGWAGGLHQSLHAWVGSGWIFRVTQEDTATLTTNGRIRDTRQVGWRRPW